MCPLQRCSCGQHHTKSQVLRGRCLFDCNVYSDWVRPNQLRVWICSEDHVPKHAQTIICTHLYSFPLSFYYQQKDSHMQATLRCITKDYGLQFNTLHHSPIHLLNSPYGQPIWVPRTQTSLSLPRRTFEVSVSEIDVFHSHRRAPKRYGVAASRTAELGMFDDLKKSMSEHSAPI